jgi:hypothetical protein
MFKKRQPLLLIIWQLLLLPAAGVTCSWKATREQVAREWKFSPKTLDSFGLMAKQQSRVLMLILFSKLGAFCVPGGSR